MSTHDKGSDGGGSTHHLPHKHDKKSTAKGSGTIWPTEASKTLLNIEIEDEPEMSIGRVPTISSMQSKRGVPDDGFLELYKYMKEAAERAVQFDESKGKPGVRAKVLLLSDNRTDPNSDKFDHMAFMIGARQFMNQMGLDYARMPVVFDDLKVYGNNVTNTRIRTVGSTLAGVFRPIASIFESIYRFRNSIAAPKLEKAKELIHGVSGIIKPGELVLVIGRPGSGCSTLLRVLANRTSTFKEIKGKLSFGGLTSKEVHEKYRGEVVYSEENDPHYPSLTVRQTLDFALQCRVPDALIRSRLIPTILRLYGLVNCQNTVVGDELLRGVSGGEKKRVSLAEATCVGGSVAAFDGCTKGLDAASALDFVKGLRNFCDFQGRAVVASCYQSSDAMFDLFDKVIILSEGYCVFQGSTSLAIPYFESLGFVKNPRDTKAEFLTVAANSGKAIKGEAQKNLDPILLQALKTEFTTTLFQRKKFMNTEKLADKPFNVPFRVQAKLLLIRELQIIRGNPIATIIRFIFAALMAVIVGSVFYKLPTDTSGTYTRGGVIFFAMLFSSTSALADVPKIMHGRPVLYKHVDFALYRTSTYFLTQYFLNIWLDLIQVLFLAVIVYSMAGLQASAGKFFFFFLTLFITSQTFGLIVKAVANGSETTSISQRLCGFVLMLLIINSGYIVPQPSIHPWFIWVFWLNPIAYGFKSLMLNEFSGLSFSCNSSSSLVPYGLPYYSNISYQTCTLAGAKPGQSFVDGTAYLQTYLNINPDFIWWNLLIITGMWFVMIIVNCIIIEVSHHDKAGVSVKLFKEEKGDNKNDIEANRNTKVVASLSKPAYQSDPDRDAVNTLTWKDIHYQVPHPKDKRAVLQLLSGVSAYAKPGTMTALMGSSGAGKTTMLDVVAQRKTMGTISGTIFVGSDPQNKDFKRLSGYCEQMDVHNRDATVREALQFSAYLRQPKSVSKEEKDSYCEYIIDLLNLRPLADALIGDLHSGIGLTMEERKRLTIGVELAAKPKIIFLDEPTSGLDEQASLTIIKLMKNLAAQGHALLVTIHQPSAMLFGQFDRLLLLGRGGKMIYFGDLGNDCQTLLNYFEKNGAPKCDPKANPAEYMLDCIGAGTAKGSNVVDWFSVWSSSAEYKRELEIIDDIRIRAEMFSEKYRADIQQANDEIRNGYMTDIGKTKIVMERMFTSYWRSVEYNIGRVLFQILAALLIGFTFYQAPNTPTGANNRVFAIFMASILGVVIVNLVQPMFFAQREYAIREAGSGTYGPTSFAIAITTTEIPFAIIAGTFFYCIFYFTVGLNPSSERAGYFYIS
ncbi:hypothetical protein HDU76_002865 [Blyttiomyces sp. JEL0837]|nr:hypothetical protein HDU76_002865 [Blyttiomyces sp. JEL0837]